MNASEERVLFYHAIGSALEQWARVEYELEETVVACIHPKDAGAISAGFNSVENFRSKLAMCNAMVVQQFGSSQHIEAWKRVKERVAQLSQKRNKIAHNRHEHISNGVFGRRYALSPSRQAMKTEPPLFLRDIEAARLEFLALTASLRNVRALLLGLAVPHATSDEQPRNPPTLRNIRDQIRAELGGFPPPLRRSSSLRKPSP